MKERQYTVFFKYCFRVIVIALLVSITLLIVTTPLEIESQILFGISGALMMLLVSKFKFYWSRLALILMSLLISSRYLYWRVTDTLVFSTPLETILGVGLLMAELYAWVILVLGFIQTAWPLNRRIVPLPKNTALWPTVDVYIPTYNESLEIVQDTVLAALNLDYPKDRFKVYILDDGKRPEFGAFASAAGVGYITRDNNNHAKAGNLNNALTKTDGELICIFDCDHVATRIFLQATIGAFVAEPKLALLQTPHYFYSPDPFERNLNTFDSMPGEAELFYGPVQQGNDYWNAAFFCGSCAVIRRSALEETDGFAVQTVTEDAHTALRLQRKGWNTAFLGIPLAAGLATERLSLHIGQRARWARGMCQIFRVDNPLFGKGLTLPQRLCYLNAMLHFQFPLPRVVFTTAPLVYLLFGLNIIQASPQLLLAYALPHLFHAIYTNSLLQGRYRYSFWGEIYETVLAFALVRPTMAVLWNPKKGKFNVTDKGGLLEQGYFDYHAVRPHLFTLALLVAAVIWGVIRLIFDDIFIEQPFVLGLNLFWAGFNIIILLAAIAVAREAKQIRNTVRIAIELPAVLYLSNGKTLSALTFDLSMGGVRLTNPLGEALIDEKVEEIELSFDDEVLLFPVTTIATDADTLRFHFRELPIRQRKKLVNVVMGRAEAWISHENYPDDSPLRSFGMVLKVVMGLFTRRDRNTSLTHWRQRLLGGWKLRLLLVTSITLGIAAIASRAWSATESYEHDINFREAGFLSPLIVSANGGSIGVNFTLRQDEVVSAANLDLALSYPKAKFPKDSYLEVLLNGEPIQSVALDAFGGDGVDVDIPVPPTLILSQNDLTFKVKGQTDSQCYREPDATQNEVIIANTSTIKLKLTRLPRTNDLASFAAPFFDKGIMGTFSIPMIIPDNASEQLLEASAILASYFGALGKFRNIRFPVSHGQLPDDNTIALVIGDQLAGIRLDAPQGPELRLMNNPANPIYKLLLVMGRNDEELMTAARFLVSQSQMKGSRVKATPITLAKRQPYDAPNWVSINAPIKLQQIATANALVARGVNHEANEVNFRTPPDLFRWRGRPMSMDIDYLFPEGDWLDERRSKLNVTLNGKFLTSLPVNNTGIGAGVMQLLGYDVRKQKATIEIPAYLLYGENKLQFYFDLRLRSAAVNCNAIAAQQIISRVLPDSSIDLRGATHFTSLPNLSYFISAGFPFTRMADLSETLVMLPKRPSVAELQTFLVMMSRMGQSTGYPAYGVTVQKGTDRSSPMDKDVLVVAALEHIRSSNLLTNSPFMFERNRLDLKPVSIAEKWLLILKGDWGRQEKTARRQLDSQDYFSGLASFITSKQSARVTVIAATSQDAMLPSLINHLNDPEASREVHGDLVIFNNQQIRSYRVGPTQSSGELSWDMSLRWYFGQHMLQLLLILLFGILLGAILLYPLLKKRAKARLQQVRKDKDE